MQKKCSEEAIFEIGSVAHFFLEMNIAIMELMLPLSVGERTLIYEPLTDFTQTFDSLQIDLGDIQRGYRRKKRRIKTVASVKRC
jgi:hypothetical protein